jgi:protein tyrosine/serine phosphatase
VLYFATATVLHLTMRSPPTSWRRRAAIGLAAIATATLAITGGVYLAIQHDDNLHAVEPGVVYRSAQMSGAHLRRTIEAEHIRAVLNLRGPNPGKDWYDAEVAAARSEGVAHIDIALSARQELTPAQLGEVRRALAEAPRPLLIHCNGGSDRTGLVSALYALSRGATPAKADEQLALRYGHFPWLGSKSVAMDRTFAAVVAASGAAAR